MVRSTETGSSGSVLESVPDERHRPTALQRRPPPKLLAPTPLVRRVRLGRSDGRSGPNRARVCWLAALEKAHEQRNSLRCHQVHRLQAVRAGLRHRKRPALRRQNRSPGSNIGPQVHHHPHQRRQVHAPLMHELRRPGLRLGLSGGRAEEDRSRPGHLRQEPSAWDAAIAWRPALSACPSTNGRKPFPACASALCAASASRRASRRLAPRSVLPARPSSATATRCWKKPRSAFTTIPTPICTTSSARPRSAERRSCCCRRSASTTSASATI